MGRRRVPGLGCLLDSFLLSSVGPSGEGEGGAAPYRGPGGVPQVSSFFRGGWGGGVSAPRPEFGDSRRPSVHLSSWRLAAGREVPTVWGRSLVSRGRPMGGRAVRRGGRG